MEEYTREEAIEKVLAIRARFGGVMPNKRDYDEDESVDLDGLIAALGVKNYAGVNIAVLRELRKREAQNANILDGKESKWSHENFVLNEKKREEREFVERRNGTYVKPFARIKKRVAESKTLYWDDKVVAELVMKFYNQYGRVPSDKDVQVGEAFRTMEEVTPSSKTLYRVLGGRRSEWLESCQKILNYQKARE